MMIFGILFFARDSFLENFLPGITELDYYYYTEDKKHHLWLEQSIPWYLINQK